MDDILCSMAISVSDTTEDVPKSVAVSINADANMPILEDTLK